MKLKRNALALMGAGVLIASLAACGGDDGDDGDGGGGDAASGAPWIVGTTETVTALDPAGSYDFASWNLQYGLFEQLRLDPRERRGARGRRGRVLRVRRPADGHLHAARRA